MTKSMRRPSIAVVAALFVAVVALVFSQVGSAVAGIDAVSSKAISKSQVKKIAKKVADKELKANVAGSHVNLADSATTATNATNATTAGTATNLAAPEAFRNIGAAGQPAFTNAWANFGGGRATAGFYIDKGSVVHLKGSITGGTSGTSAFTLPVGYRPASDVLSPSAAGRTSSSTSSSAAPVRLGVFCNAACSGSVGFDAVSFRVGAGGARPAEQPRSGDTPDG